MDRIFLEKSMSVNRILLCLYEENGEYEIKKTKVFLRISRVFLKMWKSRLVRSTKSRQPEKGRGARVLVVQWREKIKNEKKEWRRVLATRPPAAWGKHSSPSHRRCLPTARARISRSFYSFFYLIPRVKKKVLHIEARATPDVKKRRGRCCGNIRCIVKQRKRKGELSPQVSYQGGLFQSVLYHSNNSISVSQSKVSPLAIINFFFFFHVFVNNQHAFYFVKKKRSFFIKQRNQQMVKNKSENIFIQ